MASGKDELIYFPIRARGEAIRMMYVVAGQEFDDVRLEDDSWAAYKPETPFGELPTLTTPDGVLSQSNVIARHVGRKLGLVGSGQWEETLHDLVTECAHACVDMHALPGLYKWLVFKMIPTPENSEELLKNANDKWIQVLNYIQSIADKRGKKYIVGDELGLAELFLYCAMEFSKIGTPNVMALTPWAKQFTEKVAQDPKLKKYLAERPDAQV